MKRHIFIFLTIFIIILSAAFFYVGRHEQEQTEAPNQTFQQKVDTVTRQYRNGTITREEANEKFCTITARSTNEQQDAIEAIKVYAKNPNLKVEYKCNNFSLNNPTLNPTEETYSDGQKFYIIDIASNKVIRVQ